MTLVLDTAFHERTAVGRRHALRDALKRAMNTPGFLAGRTPEDAALSRLIDAHWPDAEGPLGLNAPISMAKHVLIILTQGRWTQVPLHHGYVRRMIGTPSRDWSLDSGVLAAFQNVVAAHHLAPALCDFVIERKAAA